MKVKRKPDQQKRYNGKAIRVSQDVLTFIRKQSDESYDQAFRRALGLDNKNGTSKATIYWMLERPQPRIFKTRAKALGESILYMVQAGRERRERPKKAIVIK